MQLRHIRPRSVDWYDALLEEEVHRFNRRLEPQKLQPLIIASEPQRIDIAAMGPKEPRLSATRAY